MKNLSLEKLWESKNETEWKAALDVYYSRNPKNLEIEQEIITYNVELFNKMTPEEWYKFLEKYFKWKYTQANRTPIKHFRKYKEEDKLNELNQIKQKFIEVDKTHLILSIETLSQIKGLGPSGASGLLALLFPKIYGTVDQFVIKSLMKVKKDSALKLIDPKNINANQVEYVIEILKRKAEELNFLFKTNFWTPRKIDMIFWSFR